MKRFKEENFELTKIKIISSMVNMTDGQLEEFYYSIQKQYHKLKCERGYNG